MRKTKIIPTGEARIGQQVVVPDLGVIGEVIEISNDIENLVLKVKVASEDGFKTVDVEDLVVEAVVVVKKIRLSEAFKFLWMAIKNLFRKKK